MAIRPVCDPNNSKSGFNIFGWRSVFLLTLSNAFLSNIHVESKKLYSEVQCDAVQCSCTNPVTGAPAEPARQFKVAAKDVMVCSGTKVHSNSPN